MSSPYEIIHKMTSCDNGFNMNIETVAADAMVVVRGENLFRVPHPSEDDKKKLAEMGVKVLSRVDDVLTRIECPSGWNLRTVGRDTRCRELVDASERKVANVFLKNTGYDYYGSFCIV